MNALFWFIALVASVDQIDRLQSTVKENALLLNANIASDKDSTSAPVRSRFTSMIGQDIKGMKFFRRNTLCGWIDPEVKETILNAAKHFENWEQTVEEVSLLHTSKYGVATLHHRFI